MKKTRLVERFQQLAGIKPLYESASDVPTKIKNTAGALTVEEFLPQTIDMDRNSAEDELRIQVARPIIYFIADTNDDNPGQIIGQPWDLYIAGEGILANTKLDPAVIGGRILNYGGTPIDTTSVKAAKSRIDKDGFDTSKFEVDNPYDMIAIMHAASSDHLPPRRRNSLFKMENGKLIFFQPFPGALRLAQQEYSQKGEQLNLSQEFKSKVVLSPQDKI